MKFPKKTHWVHAALFSTSIHSILTDLQSSFPLVRVLAYLDDVFSVRLDKDVLSSLDSLRPAFSNIGLQTSTNKCEIYSPSGSLRSCRSDVNDISVIVDGTMILDAPNGNKQYVSAACCQYADTGKQLCAQLRSWMRCKVQCFF